MFYIEFYLLDIHCLLSYTFCVFQVPALSASQCHRMLLHCLASEKRQLTPQQLEMAVGVLEQCPVPLFLQLMLQELKHWSSYTEIHTTFATNIEGM